MKRAAARLGSFVLPLVLFAACSDEEPALLAPGTSNPPADGGGRDIGDPTDDAGDAGAPPTEDTETVDPPTPEAPPARGDFTSFTAGTPGVYRRVTGLGLLGDTLYIARFRDLGQGDQKGEPSLWTCSVKADCKTLTQVDATMTKRSPWAIAKSGPDLFVYSPVLDLGANPNEILRIQPDGTIRKTALPSVTQDIYGVAVMNGAALVDGRMVEDTRQTLVSLSDGATRFERTGDGNNPVYESFATPSRLFTIDRRNATASSPLSVVNPTTGARTTYLDGKVSVAFAFGERVVGFEYTRTTATRPEGIFACESDTSCNAPVRGTTTAAVWPDLVLGPVGDELLYWGLDAQYARIESCTKSELLTGRCTPTRIAPTAPKKDGPVERAPIVAHDPQWLFYVGELSKIVRVRLSVP